MFLISYINKPKFTTSNNCLLISTKTTFDQNSVPKQLDTILL